MPKVDLSRWELFDWRNQVGSKHPGVKEAPTSTCLRDKCPASHQLRGPSWSYWPWQAALSSEINLSTKLKGRKGRRARTQTSLPIPSPIPDVRLSVGGINHPAWCAIEDSSPSSPSNSLLGACHQPCTCHWPQTLNSQTGTDAGCRWRHSKPQCTL